MGRSQELIWNWKVTSSTAPLSSPFAAKRVCERLFLETPSQSDVTEGTLRVFLSFDVVPSVAVPTPVCGVDDETTNKKVDFSSLTAAAAAAVIAVVVLC